MLNDLYKIKDLEELDIIIEKIDNIDIMSSDTSYLLNERILLKNTLYSVISAQKNSVISKNKGDLNLSHLFKKRIFSARRIKIILDAFPNVNRYLGCVPKIFLENAKNKPESVKQILEIFSKYSKILNYSYDDMEEEYNFNTNTNSLANELSNVINKNVSIDYIGHGVNGNGFKITIDNKNYFYKVFYPHNKFHDSKINYLHGGLIEPAFGMYAKHNARKNQFVKFYFGKIATKYDRDAFMLTEYLEDKPKFLPEKLRIDYLTVKESEIRRYDNIKEGKIVDFGGLILNPNKDFKNPQIRKMVRVILNHIKYNHDSCKFSFSWEITDSNLKKIQAFVKKYNYEIYLKALNIIQEQTNISDEILEYLRSVNETKLGIKDIKTLKVNDIFATDLAVIKENFIRFKIKCLTESIPMSSMFDGYIILEITSNIICIIFYDGNNTIKSIRLDKKVDNKYQTMLEVKSSMIPKFAMDKPFYEIIS